VTVNPSFDQYVYAVKSKRVHFSQLLPPEYPSIRLWFRYDNFQHKLHRHCPGKGSWHAQFARDFMFASEAVSALAGEEQKFTFWCIFYSKGLFFPKTCAEHSEEDEIGSTCNSPISRILPILFLFLTKYNFTASLFISFLISSFRLVMNRAG